MANEIDAIPAPDLRFLQPIRPVRDNTGEQIEAMGNVLLEGNKLRKTGQLQDDLEQLERELLDPQDQAELDRFGKEMERITGLKNAGREAEFRVRAEAKMKEYIASSPFLADDLRKKAASTIGFDPTGSAIRAKFADLGDDAAAQSAIQAAMLSQGKSWGMDVRDFGSPEWNQRYQHHQQTQEAVKLLDANSKFDTRNANLVASATFQNTNALINETSESLFGKNYQSLTPAEWAAIDPNLRSGFIAQLNNLRNTLPFALRQQFPNANETTIGNIVDAQSAQIDFVLNQLDPTQDAARIENRYNAVVNLDMLNILGTQEGRLTAAWAGMSGGQPLTGRYATQAQGKFLEIISGLNADSGWRFDPNLDPKDQEEVVKGTASTVRSWMSGVDYTNLTPEDQAQARVFMDNYTAILNNDGRAKPNHLQAVLESLANPNVKNFIQSLPQADDSLRNVIDGAKDYAITVSNAASNEAAQFMLTGTIGTTADGQQPGRHPRAAEDMMEARLVNGQVQISALVPAANAKARTMQKDYAYRINTAIQAVSNVAGVDMPTAAQMLFRFNPASFGWIKGARDENTVTENGQSFNVVGQ